MYLYIANNYSITQTNATHLYLAKQILYSTTKPDAEQAPSRLTGHLLIELLTSSFTLHYFVPLSFMSQFAIAIIPGKFYLNFS